MSMFDNLSKHEPKKGTAPKKPSTASVVHASEGIDIATTPSGLPVMVRKGRVGKSSDPDYGTLLTYIPKDVKTKAIRKWQDENPDKPDASDMVEAMLRDFLTR